jgi:hypothetical protein
LVMAPRSRCGRFRGSPPGHRCGSRWIARRDQWMILVQVMSAEVWFPRPEPARLPPAALRVRGQELASLATVFCLRSRRSSSPFLRSLVRRCSPDVPEPFRLECCNPQQLISPRPIALYVHFLRRRLTPSEKLCKNPTEGSASPVAPLGTNEDPAGHDIGHAPD